MGFTGGKTKMSVEEFCRWFYDCQVFQAEIGGVDVVPVFWDSVKKQLQDADSSFAAIEQPLFQREMTAVRLELFSLAWLHKFKQDQFTIPQSIFTRKYLDENQKLTIWEIMGKYNHAIADSVTLTANGERMVAREVVKVNLARSNMCEKWCEANLGGRTALTEPEKDICSCVASVINRTGADLRQRGSIGAKWVAACLAERLGCSVDMSTDAKLKMTFIVLMLYDGAVEALRSVSLQT